MLSRRAFLNGSMGAAVAAAQSPEVARPIPGERPFQDPSVTVLNPGNRVPLSLIIDDSTCLVNLNKFAAPQFNYVWEGQRQPDPWETWPNEIPDDFVRKFIDWCGENDVKGKYSVVPYPACVGRLDRILPGWPWEKLDASLKLVRERVTQNWDIHPEMVSHTWVINTKTGQPYPERSRDYMENWNWSVGRSTDEIADYMRYALQILHNVDLPCEGVTTPGGFGSKARPQLAQGTFEACRDVFQAEVPHYFRDLYSEGEESVAPRIFNAKGLKSEDPQCVVSIIGCTGDWTGGWNCSSRGSVDRFITADLTAGRMVDVIERGEPGCLVCHWTGIYFNGEEVGFKVFQEAVRRIHSRYGKRVQWLKLSEIARYWAAKELTEIRREGKRVLLDAPFGTPNFTLRVPTGSGDVRVAHGGSRLTVTKLAAERDAISFDLPKGRTVIEL